LVLGLARRRGAQPRVEALDHAADRLLALATAGSHHRG